MHPRRITGARARPEIYLLLGMVFGILWFALIAGLYVAGLFGRLALLSLPNVVVAQLLLRPIGRFERRLIGRFLGREIPPPAPIRFARATGSKLSALVNIVRRGYAVVQDGPSWRVLAWVLVRVVIGPLGGVLVILPALLVLAPLAVLLGGNNWLLLGPLGLAAWPVLRRATRVLVALHLRLGGWALGPSRADIAAAALARAAQAEEQVRLDQELHDSIGHMLSMIVVQAGAGAHVFDQDPEFARRALGTIEQRGRAALGELDRLLAGYSPAGAIGDERTLSALIGGARDAGMDVVSRVRVGRLPPAVGRGVYRIVQEALTNAAKHAPGAAVRLDVAADDQAVAVSVVNDLGDARPAADRPPGRGLASIRDRAGLLGGEAGTGTTEDGRFVVRAVLPAAAQLPAGATLRCSFARQCTCLGCTIRRTVLG